MFFKLNIFERNMGDVAIWELFFVEIKAKTQKPPVLASLFCHVFGWFLT